MIDVMMFLLVFFVLISINVLPALGLKVALPSAAQAEKVVDRKKVTLTLARNGNLFLDGNRISLDELPSQLTALGNGDKSKLAVIIAGDEAAELGELVHVLDAVKSAGIGAASIITSAK